MPKPAKVVIAFAAVALGATALVTANATAQAQEPGGKVFVFVNEGSQLSKAGTKLKVYDAAPTCQAFPPGAHVISNTSDRQLQLYADPACVFPAPPPFNFIKPGYGAHVSPTGGFRAS